MGTQNRDTAAAILEASRKEFMEYGYEKASLRRIAKEASVTTGAITSMTISRRLSCFCAAVLPAAENDFLTGWPRWRSSHAMILWRR